MNLSKVYGKKESDDHATSLFTSLQILFVSVLCTAAMAGVDALEFCLPHSAGVHCTPGPLRLGTPSPLCMALSQTTLPIAQLTPLPSAPLLTDPPRPKPSGLSHALEHTVWQGLESWCSLLPPWPGLLAPHTAETGNSTPEGCTASLLVRDLRCHC